jgi:hypothetical protein
MSTTSESEDDISNIFNNPPSSSHNNNNNTDINNPAEHDQHDTSHVNIFNQTDHPSDNEVTDERMADADDPIDLLIEELQSLYHLNDHFAPIAMKAAKVSISSFFLVSDLFLPSAPCTVPSQRAVC